MEKHTHSITFDKKFLIEGGHTKELASVEFSPCGTEFLSCGGVDETIKFWSMKN